MPTLEQVEDLAKRANAKANGGLATAIPAAAVAAIDGLAQIAGAWGGTGGSKYRDNGMLEAMAMSSMMGPHNNVVIESNEACDNRREVSRLRALAAEQEALLCQKNAEAFATMAVTQAYDRMYTQNIQPIMTKLCDVDKEAAVNAENVRGFKKEVAMEFQSVYREMDCKDASLQQLIRSNKELADHTYLRGSLRLPANKICSTIPTCGGGAGYGGCGCGNYSEDVQ